MDDHRPRPARRRRTNQLLKLLLSFGAALVVTVPGTHAAWTDPVQGISTIATGSVDLKVQGSDAVTGYTSLNLSNMEPGDSSAGLLTVRNAGTAPLRYYIDASVTNADSKGLGAALTAKVTADATTNGTTCSAAALTGTGSTFGSNLVGSAASPRTLEGGTTETLCIQAKLPEGGVAVGAATTIAFTVNAFTGSAATPGWTDAVPVSGTSMTSANAFYLGTNAAGNTTSSTLLPLRRSGPTLTTLFNYDTDRDSTAGLLLKASGGQAGRIQQWYLPITGSPLTLNGTASLRIWSAVTGFSTTLSGGLSVSLYDCDSGGSSCSPLAAPPAVTANPWSGGSSTWVSKTLPITTVSGSYTWQVGRSLMVQVSSAGANDMLIAYDTTAYRTAVLIQ